MSQELPFDPFPYIENPHHQTIINGIYTFFSSPKSEQKLVNLGDGDQLSLEVSTPADWKPSDLTVLLLHGLCGSHKSPNVLRMANRLIPKGIRVVRINMRGCGSGRGLAKFGYHSGRSDDIFCVIKALKKEHPDSPMILVGFSLGASIVLKLAGELNAIARSFLIGVIAISPPVDLYSSVQMLGRAENAIYEKYFYKELRSDVHYRHKTFKQLPPLRLPRGLKMYEFDQLYTAPTHGFKNAVDYYSKCSAFQYVGDIEVPSKILFAKDDPIVAASSLDHCRLPSNVAIFKTANGGHLGYLGHPSSKGGLFWLDSQLVDWITELAK